MIVNCGNCGIELGDFETTTAVKCPECQAVTQFVPKNINMRAAYSTPEQSGPEEPPEPPPDGTRVICPVCKRNLLGIWQNGALHIKHQGREWMTQGGSIAVRCHPKCGGILNIDTRAYTVTIVSSFDNFLESVGIVDAVVDATPSAVDLANELGVDLTKVTGTGKDGRVTQPDVRGYYEQLKAHQGSEG